MKKTFARKLTGLVLVLALLTSVAFGAMAQSLPADGVYEGSANGMGGELKVAVTVEGGKIADVTVNSHKETAGISDPAIEQIPAAIVAAQSTEVDGVSGATVTSDAIKAAVASALAKRPKKRASWKSRSNPT